MYAVCVTIDLNPGQMDAFLPLMIANAEASRLEPGCQRFDICIDDAYPDSVFLYEIYDTPEAFQDHLKTPHFLEFDSAVEPYVRDKSAKLYATVT